MMLLKKFWTVICPDCKKVRGIVYPQKTVSCFGCGKTHRVKNLRIWARYFTPEEMTKGLTYLKEEGYGR